MTDPLSRLRAEVKAATPGEWACPYGLGDGDISAYDKDTGGWVGDVEAFEHRLSPADAALIVTATRLARAVVDEGTVTLLGDFIDGLQSAGTTDPHRLAEHVLTALASLALGEE